MNLKRVLATSIVITVVGGSVYDADLRRVF